MMEIGKPKTQKTITATNSISFESKLNDVFIAGYTIVVGSVYIKIVENDSPLFREYFFAVVEK